MAQKPTVINNNGNLGYKVSWRLIDVSQRVRDAEGADWDLPYYIYEFKTGARRFVQYKPYGPNSED